MGTAGVQWRAPPSHEDRFCRPSPRSSAALRHFRIETNKDGRAIGVTYFDGERRERFQRSRAVVVCANGAETPRLLLMSANTQFPNGLANSSGLVRKYLMFNYSSRALGIFEHELNEHKSVQVTRILHDFYDSDPRRGLGQPKEIRPLHLSRQEKRALESFLETLTGEAVPEQFLRDLHDR